MEQQVGGDPGGRPQLYRKNPRLADQNLGGKTVVLHYEGERLLGLNETGTFVWSLLDGRRTVDEIAAEVARRDDVAIEQATEAVGQFLDQLAARELVEIVPPQAPGEQEDMPKESE